MSSETAWEGSSLLTQRALDPIAHVRRLRARMAQRTGSQPTLIGLVQGMLEPLRKESPPPSQPAMGFFTDTSKRVR